MNVMTPPALLDAAKPGPARDLSARSAPGGAQGAERGGEQVGDIVAAWEVLPGALLLLGWQREALPARGTARLGRCQSDHGPFRCVSWALQAGGGASGAAQAFALAVRLPGPAQAGQTLVLRPEGRADDRRGVPDILARLPERLHAPLAFASEAARLAGEDAMPLARFLIDILVQPGTAGRADVRAMLGAFLSATAEPDGCVEVLAGVPESCVALQGWGQAGPASLDCVLVGSGLSRRTAQAAAFARPDIALPCAGAVLVLPPDAAGEAGGATELYLLTGARPRRRAVLATVRRLDPSESAVHLRDLLPVLRGAAPVLDRLRAAARPRFAGHDTLNTGAPPVRAAVDLAARTEGGAYLHGWLLDPARLVAEVTLRSGCGASARLDATWTRIPRPDVTEAFRQAPGFAPSAGAHAHGFAAHAASVRDASGEGSGAGSLHLDIVFRDGSVAFLPLQDCGGDAALQARLLESVDLHKPSGLAVIERQLGPLFLGGRRRVAEAAIVCGADPGWATALVVALPQQPDLPRALLSQFLHDPLRADEGLVLVCGESWQASDLDRLRAELAFRALPAMLLRVGGQCCPVAALEAALALTSAASVLMLGWGTHGRAPGWREALYAARADHAGAGRERTGAGPGEAGGGEACFCATQLYEDYSIRFAGIDGVQALAQAPWFAAGHGMAGLPASLARGDTVPVLAGSLAACLMPRSVATALGGGGGRYATAEATELDFFLRLGRAGIACLWVPSARVYALDSEPGQATGHGGPGHGVDEVARLVDGWCLRETWGGGGAGSALADAVPVASSDGAGAGR